MNKKLRQKERGEREPLFLWQMPEENVFLVHVSILGFFNLARSLCFLGFHYDQTLVDSRVSTTRESNCRLSFDVLKGLIFGTSFSCRWFSSKTLKLSKELSRNRTTESHRAKLAIVVETLKQTITLETIGTDSSATTLTDSPPTCDVGKGKNCFDAIITFILHVIYFVWVIYI